MVDTRYVCSTALPECRHLHVIANDALFLCGPIQLAYTILSISYPSLVSGRAQQHYILSSYCNAYIPLHVYLSVFSETLVVIGGHYMVHSVLNIFTIHFQAPTRGPYAPQCTVYIQICPNGRLPLPTIYLT